LLEPRQGFKDSEDVWSKWNGVRSRLFFAAVFALHAFGRDNPDQPLIRQSPPLDQLVILPISQSLPNDGIEFGFSRVDDLVQAQRRQAEHLVGWADGVRHPACGAPQGEKLIVRQYPALRPRHLPKNVGGPQFGAWRYREIIFPLSDDPSKEPLDQSQEIPGTDLTVSSLSF